MLNLNNDLQKANKFKIIIYKLANYKLEGFLGLLILSLGMLSGFGVSTAQHNWYADLLKPAFTPPAWIFGPVWTILYLMLGAALGQIIKAQKKFPAQTTTKFPTTCTFSSWGMISLFLCQLGLNFAWSPIFFYYQQVELALWVLSGLWLSVLGLIIWGWLSCIRTACWLLVPYLLWLSFAWMLNYKIYIMNLA